MNIIKMIILPKAIYRFNQVIQFVKSVKLPMVFFTKLEEKKFNLYGNRKDFK